MKKWIIEKKIKKGDYLYAIVNNHPKATKHGYVLYHRIVMENHLGRLLEDNEVVHHKNEVKRDNRISNLEVMTLSEHSRLHNSTGRTMVSLVCPNCGNTFEREKRNTHLSKGGTNTFCSRKCNGTFNGPKSHKSKTLIR